MSNMKALSLKYSIVMANLKGFFFKDKQRYMKRHTDKVKPMCPRSIDDWTLKSLDLFQDAQTVQAEMSPHILPMLFHSV